MTSTMLPPRDRTTETPATAPAERPSTRDAIGRSVGPADDASERAERLRRRASMITDPVLSPLTQAMKRRAAELELEAAVRRAAWA